MRAAIYARFSSDLQDARSITDQVALARRYVDGRGLPLVGVYEDAAISGASVVNRPGLQRLLSDAAARKFEVLVTESLDRLSRSQADIAALYERLSFMGVRIETLADGHVSEIHVGLKGTMAALFLKDLAQKTKRGQMGRVKAGRIPGGKSYGYDVVASGDDRGRRLINEREAALVRRIYSEYVQGRGTLAIVKALNNEGVPGPTGKPWNLSTVVGSPKRRNGLLNNELYNGVIVYNRQRFMKDPATGKRVSRPNPESEWVRQDVPELRIVDEETWHAAQRLRESRSTPHFYHRRRPQRLLSGLVFCGCCGSKFNIVMRDYMRCSSRTNSGLCPNSRSIKMGEVEERVLVAYQREVLAPEMIDLAVQAWQDEHRRALGDRDSMRERLQSELVDIERKSSRLLGLVEDGHADPAVAGPRLNELAVRKRQLTSELAQRPIDELPVIAPDAAVRFQQLVGDLRSQLLEAQELEIDTDPASQIIRGTVRRITVTPIEDADGQALEIETGPWMNAQTADQYCESGCGGPQPINYVVHVLPAGPSATCFVVQRSRDLAVAA